MFCPRCQRKIPIKDCLLLSNLSILTCKHCKAKLRPEKMSSATFALGFLVGGPLALYVAIKYNSLPKGLSFGLICGLVLYLIVVVYTYKFVKLYEI